MKVLIHLKWRTFFQNMQMGNNFFESPHSTLVTYFLSKCTNVRQLFLSDLDLLSKNCTNGR